MAQIPDANRLIQLQTDYVAGSAGGMGGLDDLTAAKMATGTFNLQTYYSHKEPRVAGAAASALIAGQWTSLVQYEGTPVGAMATPTGWVNPTNVTAGAIPYTSPGGSRNTRALSIGGQCSLTSGIVLIYDRLGHMGGMSGMVTTAQNANGGSAGTLTRTYPTGGNFLMAEMYMSLGATTTTLTASYTNQASTAGQTTQAVTFGGTNVGLAQQAIILPLAAGDTGVTAVTSATVLATTGTAGNFGLTIGHVLYSIPFRASGQGMTRSFANGPMSYIAPGACLCALFLPTIAAAPMLDIFFELAEE